MRLGSRVRIGVVNIGMDHHPIHLHGHTFVVTGTEAGRQPETMWGPMNTVLVGVAQARDIEFVATLPMTTTGKILRRELRDAERAKAATGSPNK